MSPFRPLSARGKETPQFDGLTEGFPRWLHAPVLAWLQPLLNGYGVDTDDRLATLQNALRLDPPFNWHAGARSAYRDCVDRLQTNEGFALDVLDFLVQFIGSPSQSQELDTILAIGGSAWEVTPTEDERKQLSRRALGPVVQSIDSIRSPSQRAHHHLSEAWSALMGRNPNPSTAYREAIRAVEAAARPVVTPSDSSATLGKIVSAIRGKPEKWSVVLDKASASQVADMTDVIWKGQMDRHGTDDPSVPLAVSQGEADAAFHIALSLVRLFVSGGISREN